MLDDSAKDRRESYHGAQDGQEMTVERRLDARLELGQVRLEDEDLAARMAS